MRLTLRNLLAFMDDLLDPESARIIGQKTEESEFASGLLHRIRDVTRQAKLGSPQVIDRKAALDPNTVAEYLDNILPGDRVTDFEKACLDSDVELAEVAACHQILTLVLGEPAEVHPESRLRMYHLPETAASHTYVEGSETDAGARRIDTPATTPPAQHRQPVIPEHLLEARRRRRRLYWIASAAVILCVAVYLGVTGKLDDLFGFGDQPDDQIAVRSPSDVRPEHPDNSPEPGLGSTLTTESLSSPQSPPAPAESVPPVPSAPTPSETAASLPDSGMGPDTVPRSVVPIAPTPSPSPDNAPPETPIPETSLPTATAPPVPDPGQIASTGPVGLPDDRETMIPQPVVPEVAPQGREVGRLVYADEMALVADDVGEPFKRIAKTKPLRVGQRVVSLPTSRPMFLIDGKLTVEMVGGGKLRLLPFEQDNPPVLEVTSGRMLLAPANEVGVVAVSLQIGDTAGLLSLADSTTLVAVEVGRAGGPIADPIDEPAPVSARIWGVGATGRFSWAEAGQPEILVEGTMTIDPIGGAGSAPLPAEAPDWVRADLAGILDPTQRASGILNRALAPDDEADLILRENVDHRQREVRQLARRCLGWIEDFEDIVAVLDDPERYVEWPDLIDLLRESVRRGPKTAQAVRSAMQAEYGDRGEELYELLWRYDAEDLPSEDAMQLVQYLEDEELACRVLSFRNLNRITGLGFYYRPEETEMERSQPLARWLRWHESTYAPKRKPAVSTRPTPAGP